MVDFAPILCGSGFPAVLYWVAKDKVAAGKPLPQMVLLPHVVLPWRDVLPYFGTKAIISDLKQGWSGYYEAVKTII